MKYCVIYLVDYAILRYFAFMKERLYKGNKITKQSNSVNYSKIKNV